MLFVSLLLVLLIDANVCAFAHRGETTTTTLVDGISLLEPRELRLGKSHRRMTTLNVTRTDDDFPETFS
jgi:hypothetical protein